MRRRALLPAAAVASLALIAACSRPIAEQADPEAPGSPPQPGGGADGTVSSSDGGGEQQFPEVLEAELSADGDEFMIAVTISSPYDTPERYADGWRVLTPSGVVLAEHDLAHDHANVQPFNRTRGPFAIPEGVDEVVVEGRDLINGYGGGTVSAPVPR
ncbi:MAG: hypothetical protein DI611_14960 [Brachybacterium faecium]|nr:MAG: hypothetical protein DI611_14960 [Brachybacterium faecium]